MEGENTEIELIKGLKAGNNDAFRKLFDLYYYPLFSVAKQYVKDDFTADTLVCDLYFHIWEIRKSLDIENSLNTYLIRSIRNYSINYLQKGHVNREVSINEIHHQMFSSDEYPLGILLEKELSERINSEIEKLPEETKRVFILSRIKGMNHLEIAGKLDISVNTVKYHIKRALLFLRENLKDLFYLLVIYYML